MTGVLGRSEKMPGEDRHTGKMSRDHRGRDQTNAAGGQRAARVKPTNRSGERFC